MLIASVRMLVCRLACMYVRMHVCVRRRRRLHGPLLVVDGIGSPLPSRMMVWEKDDYPVSSGSSAARPRAVVRPCTRNELGMAGEMPCPGGAPYRCWQAVKGICPSIGRTPKKTLKDHTGFESDFLYPNRKTRRGRRRQNRNTPAMLETMLTCVM